MTNGIRVLTVTVSDTRKAKDDVSNSVAGALVPVARTVQPLIG